ncbi:MAG: hypothetical protein AB1450_14975 [Pseudomonadota bacterium]
MMTRISGLLVLTVVVLGGCATPVLDESAPGYRLPPGTAVVLQQDLAVPAGHARVFLQQGRVVAKHRLDVYRPHCNFEQRTVSDSTAVIAADRFTVTAVSEGEDFVVQRRFFVYAALSLAGDDTSPSQINRYFHYTLASSQQPGVMRLTCHGGFDLPGAAQLPSLADMRAALGEVASIERP